MGLLKKHHTPRYIVDRIAYGWWLRFNPDKPWLVPASIDFLDGYLLPSDTMVEFGSGRSTTWFAMRVGTLVSLETNADWHAAVMQQLASKGMRNVRQVLSSPVGKQAILAVEDTLDDLGERGINVVLDDGIARDEVALWAIERLSPGGILILDNANRYLPRSTRSPASIGLRGVPPTDKWKQVAERTDRWRRVWWSQGVADTAVFFKPAD